MSQQSLNAVLELILDRIVVSLPGNKGVGRSEKLLKQFHDESNKLVLEEFIREPEVSVIYIYYEASEKLVISLQPNMKKKGLYLLKSKNIVDSLRVEDFKNDVFTAEITENTLQNLNLLAHEVYFPLLSNPANRAGWSGPTSKDLMLKFSNFLSSVTITVGQSKGQTLLPQPPPEAFDTDNLVEKERIHLLESSVVQWANKIQAVLITDPEQLLRRDELVLNPYTGTMSFPGPWNEIEFWQAKSADLTSLHDQLQSDRMKLVLETLNEFKSPFASQLEKLKKDVIEAREESLENSRFLKTLKPYFTKISEELDFLRVEQIFQPLMHTILLIFKHSNSYNSKLRLTCLIQEICNGLVFQASKHISGEIIFRSIEDENVSEAVTSLKSTQQVCEKFKLVFQRYQQRANSELGEGAWDLPLETLFHRLDAFLERCADILEFTKIVLEFTKLEKIFLGGTKGKTLTQALRQVHNDFVKAVESFKNVNYDIMDISQSAFDDDFYQYRCEVKLLERRLSAILIAAFDDSNTLNSRFKLLESFEGLLDRPIIKDELDKKQSVLLEQYIQQLKQVQEIFHQHKLHPKVDINMPPIAGKLSWCRSLQDRVNEPLEKFKLFTSSSVSGGEREEVKEIERVQSSILQQLKDYELKQINEWTAEIDSTSEDKLQQPLLRRDKEARLLSVNFDPALIRLLREVKYFLTLKLPVPLTALNIYTKANQYRSEIGNLELIVSMYNEMISTLHSVERPLVEKEINQIDNTIERGITSLNWKSEGVQGVEPFIQESMECVQSVYNTVKIMKDNLNTIKKLMSDFASVALADRKNKPLSPADFEENLKKLWANRHAILAEHQINVTNLLTQTNSALKIHLASPIWKAYLEYVQDSIRDGLANTIMNSIKFICEQLDAANIEKSNLPPLLEIKLGLYANDVLFNAEDSNTNNINNTSSNGTNSTSLSLNINIDSASSILSNPRKSRRDVWQIVSDWVEGFFEIGTIMVRADQSQYVSDLKKNDGIVRYVNTLKKHLDWNQRECELLRQEYIKYEFLWRTDRNAEFQKFLQQAHAEVKAKLKAEENKLAEKQAQANQSSGSNNNNGNQSNPTTPSNRGRSLGGDNTANNSSRDLMADLEEDNEFKDSDAADVYVEMLPLEKFEEKILYYRDIGVEIAEKKSPVEIGWLKVNLQPIKISLQTWVNKWIHTYTSYLYNDVTRKLNQLEQLMNTVNQGLLAEVHPGDSITLKRVLGFIHAVRSKEKSTLKMFGPLRDTVSLLKKYGKNLDEYELKLLSDAPMKWDSTVNNVYKIKEKVNNLQNEEVDKIKQKVLEFESELKQFRIHYKENAPFWYDIEPNEAYDLIFHYHKEINQIEVRAHKLTDLEKVFELNISKHRQIKKCRAENRLLKQAWDMCSLVSHKFTDWKKTLWNDIDTDVLLVECKKLQRQLVSMPNELQSWDVYTGLVLEVKNFATVLPLVNLLHSPCMEDRHWRELKIATGKQFNKDETFCLDNMLQLQLHKFVPDVEYIVELATKEAKIAGQLKKIESQWKQLELQFGVQPKSGIAIIQRPDEILVTLEENMSALQGMQGQGKYVEHFIEQVNRWQKLLNQTETVLYDWLEVQSKWSSLEAIFLGSKDIRIQLPEDSKRFDSIDSEWKELMSNAKNTPNVIEACCSSDTRLIKLQTMKTGLEMCEKSLFQYLETKRKAFPRFYFLSNAALLDILSSGHNPQSVQKHLGDCFDNINKLTFAEVKQSSDNNEESDNIARTALGMHSKEGEEYVPLISEFQCEGPVEEWLNRLVIAMQDTLREILSRAKFTADHWDLDKKREKWLFDYPAQVALTASQIIWTEEVNSQFEAFSDGNEQAMKEYSKLLAQRLEALIQLVLGELNNRDRVKIMTLITVDVHNRDVVQRLIDSKIQDYSSFAWQSQMRMKWKPDTKDCQIRVADWAFNYCYEYVGNTGRLVITPLTDRCYITLTQAMRLIMGGAPAGPAGTGKTETTKDLGRALGLPVYVFNCSEQMNVHSLGAIFKGLSQTGAWGCFDEFNRIPIEVLSVVSSQVSSVLNALREKKAEFDFMGELIALKQTVGIFITMNPGYAGRTELPENLKTLFRSCAMVLPNIQLICENMLLSEGFLQAARLSKKFVTLYSLSSELLSKQRHYDWGLRATKAVLRVAGSLKRSEPRTDEDTILCRALRDSNMPKLVDEDKPIFRELIGDLFPGLGNVPRHADLKLQEAIQKVANERKLQAEETFVLKCVELSELLAIRHSVFVVGPAGSGKSEIWKTVINAFRLMGQKSMYEVINPKAIRNNELYGFLERSSDWRDGVLSTVMRNMSRNRPPYTDEQKHKWVVLDGDIDPNWIESLNTVMDDNKMLTLVSNERIPLTPAMRMMFEISHLDHATPATVSRAGILYINAKDIGSKPFLDSWIESRESDKEKSSLLALFNKYTTPEYLHEIQTQFQRVIPQSEIQQIKTLCYLLEGLLNRMNEQRRNRAKTGEEKLEPAVEKEQFEANFVFSCIWAFGGTCLVDKSIDHRKEFSDWWKRVFTSIKFPKDGTVFDYYVDPKSGKMTSWDNLTAKFTPSEDSYLVTKLFIPTPETTCITTLTDILIQRQRPVLLVGTGGTGKTSVINQYLHSLPDNYSYSSINLNYYTDAKTLQHIMEQSIDKRSGRIFGPSGNKKLIYFIDDLNMPQVDQYGTQSPSALLKQHMDYNSWYDTNKLERKEIHDVQYLAAMNPTAGSFTVDPRLQQMFATFACLLPNKKSLQFIYQTALTNHFTNEKNKFSLAIQELVPKLVKATIELHDSVSLKFIPSSKKFHYQFNLRDLSAIFQGICLSNSDDYTPKMIAQLWQHECLRVFSDRLVNPTDEQTFDSLLQNKLKLYFKDLFTVTRTTVDADSDQKHKVVKEQDNPLLFTSFLSGGRDAYLPVDKFSHLKTELEKKLKQYNDTNAVMNLELFSIAMEHVCRIARIIENPRGNALLVGVGGSGKQSLAKLASYICGYDVFQISVTQSYGLNDLKADMQALYMKAGVKNYPITFLLTDTQIVDDRWLVYVNDLLSSGFIPDLFTQEDKDGIIAAVRNEARSQGVADTREAIFEFFTSKVRTNLHVVLCFSPVGEIFRIRCRKFPGLISCTSIDWFHPWPRDALVSVAKRFLSDIDVGGEIVSNSIAEHMAQVHLSVNEASTQYQLLERRYNYTTPKSFLELIAFYKVLLNKKRSDLTKQTHRLEKGIHTLKQTHSHVGQLKEDLTGTLVKVEEKSEAASVLITKMGVERKKVEEQQALASIEAAKAKTVSEVANKIADECKGDLERALPILERAKEAVNCLSKASLTTLKSFTAPPGNVKRDWAAAKKMMKSIGQFLDELKAFDATSIDDSVLKKLQPILDKDFFNEENMKSASEAAANLCNWVVNIVEYNKIYKNVAPKIAAQKKAAEEFEGASAKLKLVEDRVAAMQAKLKSVTDSLKDATDDKNQVEAMAQNCQSRLELARRLVDGLADENDRWTKSIAQFQERERTLVGDTMLAASFVSYIGAFNQKFRVQLWRDQWIPDLKTKAIPLTDGVDPLLVLASDSDFAKWKNEGLAADRSSLENGAIITQCTRWPLMIDPQLQGVKWIKSRVKNLRTVQLSQKRWMQTIIQAVQMGDPVIIESVGEDLEASLDPVISRSLVVRGPQKFIKIGTDEVEYSEGFHLYLQTKLSNPHYKPEIAAQTTLINFIVTEEGLEENLLAIVVNKEKPELEEKRTALVRAINDYMVSLTDLENELLERLSNAPDDILSDVALIEGLEKTKQASTEIEQKVELAKKQEISINAARNEFRSVASEASWLYFLLIQLFTIDHMYQYSLDAFTGFFIKAMDRAKRAELTSERAINLRESIRIVIFTWVNRGLFEKHKLIFSSQLCFKLMSKGALSNSFEPAHYDYLVRGPKKLGVEKTLQLDWLPQTAWASIQKLVELEGFQKLAADMQASPNRFKEWYNKPRPESSPLPLEWRKLDETNPFMKLLVVRAMRPDRMTIAMENYVREILPNGKDFIECDAGKSFMDVLTASLDDSTTVNPIFFILSPGADPVHSVEVLAKRQGISDNKFHRIALGQGQDVIAMAKLDIGHKEGGWVVLENIHLMPNWNPELEKKLDDFAAEGSHTDFRLFISAEPSTAIPIGVLERCIKLTNEPPQGLKANLKRAFASFERDEFEFKDPKVKSILFGLCHFHSIIVERIKFGPKGLNKSYPFNTGDLMNSSTVLMNYLESGSTNDKVPWSDLRYIFGEILYGGHVTDDWDRLLVNSYLEFYMREELLDEMEMFPFNENNPEERFRSPPVLPYDQYFDYINNEMKQESPVAFGLHPNAEISVKTKQASELFTAILDLQPRSALTQGNTSNKQENKDNKEQDSDTDKQALLSPSAIVQMLIQTIVNDKSKGIEGINFNLEEISQVIVDERGPYQNVFLQECDRMNQLCKEIRRSLKELDLGLSGELQMSEKMEELFQSLYLGRVPNNWARLAYPSQRGLASWIDNLIQRASQLQNWVEDPTTIPIVVNIAHLFNPQSFLTAIMQKTAQKQKLELDKLTIQTDVTRKTLEQTDSRARDGAYVYGLYMEGARWNWNSGIIEECLPREMYCQMPVVICRAILTEKLEKTGIYKCPTYKTQRRGDTYVFTANLRSKAPPQKWVLAGVVLVMEVEE